MTAIIEALVKVWFMIAKLSSKYVKSGLRAFVTSASLGG